MEDKKWFDDWKTEHNTEGIDTWSISLPNTNGEDLKIMIDFERLNAEQMYQVEWLISHLDAALSELTKK